MSSGQDRTPSGPGDAIRPHPIELGTSASRLVDHAFLGTTAGRLSDAARALKERVLERPDAVVGLTLDASLIPAGAGITALTPLLRGGYVDWLAVSGTNLYYDTLVALGKRFHRRPVPGPQSRECGGEIVVDIRDVTAAEATLREILGAPEFQNMMGTAELHHWLGSYLRVHEKELGIQHPSLLTTAHELGVPIYNPSPADNPLGSLTAELALLGNRLSVDTTADLNEAAALLNEASRAGAPCAAWCLGRGAAANFMLDAPRHLQAIFATGERHDYELRVRMAGRAHGVPTATTDAAGPDGSAGMAAVQRPDAAGAPQQGAAARDIAISTDLSVALPLITAYIVDRVPPRSPKRLYDRRDHLLDRLRRDRLDASLKKGLTGT